MENSKVRFKVVELRLDPKNGEDGVHRSVQYATAVDAHAEAKRSAESYPESEFNPTDSTWLVKGHDGRGIRIYVERQARWPRQDAGVTMPADSVVVTLMQGNGKWQRRG